MSKEQDFVTQITKRSEDFSRWYLDVIRKAELADYSSMKGMMVIRPYGYEIWEQIQQELNARLKETGHRNAYFPLFIPESFLSREADHVEGFAPEVAWVTMGGREPLEERLAVRPTSEAIICSMYAKWVNSWRDLPVLINQWANVVRWEKVTRPFLRTTEFLWQEGHTLHETREEAQAEAQLILNIYRELAEHILALPVIAGPKSDSEKFAGADTTYTIEALMPDGKALQAGTSHFLGQNFSEAFQIRFEDRQQSLQYPWGTSWGVTTRLVGAVIMLHGDDSGLILPPRVAPIQTVIVPITRGNWKETVLPHAQEVLSQLRKAGIRVHLDDRDTFTPGWKFSEWEMRGVPVRLELGPKDIEKGQVVLVNRINREKSFVALQELPTELPRLLDQIQTQLLERARAQRDEQTRSAHSHDELIATLNDQRGLVRAGWCGQGGCEKKIKEACSATIRVLDEQHHQGFEHCAVCGAPARHSVLFAKSY